MVAEMRNWDIFCRVVDNFGDVGVCWRLARQLAREHGIAVRLWIDDLDALSALAPAVDAGAARQRCQGIEIRRWADADGRDPPGEVVIEAFACDLPPAYVETMARALPAPVWINLEYLSAEDWVGGCHGLASPHPSLPLRKRFFFPGFTGSTGGLLRERGLVAVRDAALAVLPAHEGLAVSLFCYDSAPIGALLDSLAASPLPVTLLVPAGKPLAAVAGLLGGSGPWQRGNATILPLAFTPQEDYDRLLWQCDVNFVRGEDSFVRAQWAARPFVWQIYPQPDEAHHVKLQAFLGRYVEGLGDAARSAAVDLFEAWNSCDAAKLPAAWAAFVAVRDDIGRHNRAWAERLARYPDLASTLVKFCDLEV